jgi:hypothetical protein
MLIQALAKRGVYQNDGGSELGVHLQPMRLILFRTRAAGQDETMSRSKTMPSDELPLMTSQVA